MGLLCTVPGAQKVLKECKLLSSSSRTRGGASVCALLVFLDCRPPGAQELCEKRMRAPSGEKGCLLLGREPEEV